MLAVLLLPVALAAHQGADVSGEPVQEVLLLLSRIQASIEREGKEEAAAYDKFACFCKDEVDSKQYAIEKALAKEAQLTSLAEVQTSERNTLNEEIGTLAEQISELQEDMADADQKRNWQHWRYANRSEEIETGMRAIEEAIHLTKPEAAGPPGFLQTKQEKQEPAYEYKEQSGKVVKTMEDLRGMFIEERNKIDEKEHAQLSEHELVEQARQRQLEAKQKSSGAKTVTSSDLASSIGAEGSIKSETQTARQADQAFLTDLTAKCEAKASAWDQRSQVRAGELKALQQAVEALSPAAKTAGAIDGVGRKLGVSLSQSPHKRHSKHARHARHAREHAMYAKARKHLPAKAPQDYLTPVFVQLDNAGLRSKLVAVLGGSDRAADVRGALRAGDAFADVAGMLDGLIADLRQEAADAQEEAAWCTREMTRAVTQREACTATLARKAALTDTKSTLRDSLTEDIAGLSFEIANLTKALNEETELRTENSRFNAQRLSDAKAGLESVRDAISILETYYQSVGSPTDPEPLVPEDDDASAAVDAAAPDTGFSNDGYAGNQNSGNAAVTALRQIETDFDDTVTEVQNTETQESGDYNTLKTDINNDIDAKQDLKEQKEGEKTDAEAAIDDAATDIADQKALLKQTLHEIENLKPACTATLSGADARTAARNQEIQVLNQAKSILEGGLSFGNQTDF